MHCPVDQLAKGVNGQVSQKPKIVVLRIFFCRASAQNITRHVMACYRFRFIASSILGAEFSITPDAGRKPDVSHAAKVKPERLHLGRCGTSRLVMRKNFSAARLCADRPGVTPAWPASKAMYFNMIKQEGARHGSDFGANHPVAVELGARRLDGL
jgi:hypothetical protein